MGFKKKVGKGRLDKYYYLAKEQGYRARSAFKLVQLNKKFNFLSSARVLVDLCAAPGGWLQVATKYMPVSSLIIGVDLAPIKPIPKVITFQEDITTERCRQALRNELKTWKADVFLHDGAPNVGTAWVQDAYSQSELVLMSLKLAVEFMSKGGTFVTKVFRSKDYNNLMWVFNQLFKRVEATKPPSSRNVSAEIFVVCRDFLAPKKLDPKFLDPKWVFKDLEDTIVNKQADIFHPEKHKRQREGYEDGDYTLHKTISVMEFINTSDAITVLGSANKMVFDSEEAQFLLKQSATDEEIQTCMMDLKVLGKKDFRGLLKWRLQMIDLIKAKRKAENPELAAEEERKLKAEEELAATTVEVDEEVLLEEEMENLTKEEQSRVKRARRRKNEIRTKNLQRMQLNMVTPTEIGIEQLNGETLFDIHKIKKSQTLENIYDGDMDIVISSDEDKGIGGGDDSDFDIGKDPNADSDEEETNYLGDELDQMYEEFQNRQMERDAKFKVKKLREKEGEFKGFSKDQSDSDSEDEQNAGPKHDVSDSSEDSESDEESYSNLKKKNPLVVDLKKKEDKTPTASGLSKKAALFFDNKLFSGIEEDDEDDEEEEEEEEEEIVPRKRKAVEIEEEEEEESDNESDFEIVPLEKDDDEFWSDDGEEAGKVPDYGLITAEAITLAQQLANREKTKSDLIDDGFNKSTFRDAQGLPEWFVDDERKHSKPNVPVTKEAMNALREKMKALDARPIKKIAEAKARKKFKAVKKLAKIQQKASTIAENEDLTEREKAESINKLLSKSMKKKPKKDIKVVVARGGNRAIKGRPKGVSGRYKMVDPRMRKEVRALKRVAKKEKKSRR
ncbi:AdoMet-dependent rRNA methyltransferase spb1 [Basidiobolus ranarum]|uniref:AdoMet-dependent rRNA methyltransferase spb1 n=3 Tax=Basidiobolus ranarum TaxID=34480 RepID=A0ABR2WYR4_9FUNG